MSCADSGLPVFGCCPPACEIHLARVASRVIANGFNYPTTPSTYGSCDMFRTRIDTIYDRGDGHVIVKTQQTWTHPNNILTTTILEDDGSGIRPGPQFGTAGLIVDSPPSFRWILSDGFVTPFDLGWDFSDAFSLLSVISNCDALVPDDALINNLLLDTNWIRQYASDGGVLMQSLVWPPVAGLIVGCFGPPYEMIAERSQILTGGFPPIQPGGLFGSAGDVTVTCTDLRSRLVFTSGPGCIGRQTIGNGAPHHCEIFPNCAPGLVFAGIEGPRDFIMAVTVANESVGVRCGPC